MQEMVNRRRGEPKCANMISHAYEEVREDFIKEYKAQLERRGNGEKLEIVAGRYSF